MFLESLSSRLMTGLGGTNSHLIRNLSDESSELVTEVGKEIKGIGTQNDEEPLSHINDSNEKKSHKRTWREERMKQYHEWRLHHKRQHGDMQEETKMDQPRPGWADPKEWKIIKEQWHNKQTWKRHTHWYSRKQDSHIFREFDFV